MQWVSKYLCIFTVPIHNTKHWYLRQLNGCLDTQIFKYIKVFQCNSLSPTQLFGILAHRKGFQTQGFGTAVGGCKIGSIEFTGNGGKGEEYKRKNVGKFLFLFLKYLCCFPIATLLQK